MTIGQPREQQTSPDSPVPGHIGNGGVRVRTAPVACCPVCRGTSFGDRREFHDHLHGLPGSFGYVRCNSCRSIFQNPRVVDDDLGLCYTGDYYTHESPAANLGKTLPTAGSRRDRLRRAILGAADGQPTADLSGFVRTLGHLLAVWPAMRRRARYGLPDALGMRGRGTQRCLEVGPGQGITLAQLRWLGWEAVGLDVDPIAAETARRLSQCEVRVGSLASSDFPDGSFDLIYMNHVLEHLPDLRSALERSHALLRQGGRLVLIYPNPDSLGGRILGDHSPIWDPPRHLVLPSRLGIHDLLSKIGFNAVRAKTMARCAAHYHAVARTYRAAGSARRGMCADITPRDRAFGALEHTLVLLGKAAGEEIMATCRKG
jgi:SAM-dependent methyltransferase